MSLADNTLATANDLGNLAGSVQFSGIIGDTDPISFYKFTLLQNSDISAIRTGSTFIDIVDLVADFNGNGLLDRNESITRFTTSSSSPGLTFYEPLPAGTYYIRVQDNGRAKDFNIQLVATPKPGNVSPDPGSTFSQAFNLGVLSEQRVLQDYVGDLDPVDMYTFTLSQKTNLGVFLSGETQATPVFIAADDNGNGVFDLGETITRRSSSTTSFSVTLSPGTYFIQAGQSSFPPDTQYVMSLNPVPDFSGDDTLQGTAAKDTIRGFEGNDTILGLDGDDQLLGEAGNDQLVGAGGNDRLIGGINNDRLVGDAGIDTLLGGTGKDVLDGGAGNDVIETGAGRDRILLRRKQGFDRVKDFRNGQDKVDLIGIRFNQLTLQQQGNDVLVKLGNTNMLLIEDIKQNLLNRADFV